MRNRHGIFLIAVLLIAAMICGGLVGLGLFVVPSDRPISNQLISEWFAVDPDIDSQEAAVALVLTANGMLPLFAGFIETPFFQFPSEILCSGFYRPRSPPKRLADLS